MKSSIQSPMKSKARRVSGKCQAAAVILAYLSLGISSGAEPVTGRFELLDHNGQAVSEASYDGQLRLVFFGFTRCPVVCPTTMLEITRVMHALGDRASRVQPVFITIDPGYDTVEVVADYVSHFHPAMVGLTGTAAQVEDAARSFNTAYGGTAAGDESDASRIYHSSYLYLMQADGSFLDVFGYGTKADAIVAALEQYL